MRTADSLAPVTRTPGGTRSTWTRGRLVAIVAVAGVAAMVVVGLAALATRDPESGSVAALPAEPLPGQPPIVVPPLPDRPGDPLERVVWAEERAAREPGTEATLRLAAALVEAQRRADAERVLDEAIARDPASADLRAGRALVAYDDKEPTAAIGRLREIVASDSEAVFARFALGEALLWAGRRDEGEVELRSLRDRDPESFYGIAADDLIHPGMLGGYPPFVLSFPAETGDPAATASRAAEAPRDVRAQLAHAAALMQAGRRAEAREAFDAALIADPDSVEAQVGRVVAGFQKDDPSATFALLGPLVRDHPRDASARLHLAFTLFWLRQNDPARAELRQIAEGSPPGPLRDAAERLLAALDGA